MLAGKIKLICPTFVSLPGKLVSDDQFHKALPARALTIRPKAEPCRQGNLAPNFVLTVAGGSESGLFVPSRFVE
jgi:hypothetical protein